MRTSRVMTALALVAGAALVIGYSASALSADHQDSPATLSAPTADINDVYTWMDGNNVVLAMTVYPAAPSGAAFDPTVQYVLHTASGTSILLPPSDPVDVIATFDATGNIKLWLGSTEYVTGNPGSSSGLTSADGKVKVFAGLRADPFFFNLDGFKNAVATVESVAGSLTFNEAGCPALNSAQETLLVGQLASAPDGGAPSNHFATFNGLAIVVSADKSLLTAGGPLVSVWGATYSTGAVGDAGGQ